MRKTQFISLLTLLLLTTFISSCKKPVRPVSEVIAKVWAAQSVDENNTTVYTKGGATNVKPGYSRFKLDLSNATTATLTELDNNTFTGQWEVQNDNRLILKNLTPQPTGTNGTIEFTINSYSDSQLVLTRTTASQKTGGTVNKYTLSNP